MAKVNGNSDVNAKEACKKYLEELGYSNLDCKNVKKDCCDIIGKDKKEKTIYFEVKSSSRSTKVPFGGTVMLTELYKAIENKDCYKFIVCKGKGSEMNNWSFQIFEVDEFIQYCALTTPILRYAYHPNSKKQPKFREDTFKANDELIQNMWNDFKKWQGIEDEEKVVELIADECFYKSGKTKFFSNGKDKFVVKYSKQHEMGNIKYWYGISESLYEQMKKQQLTHIIFKTENNGKIELPFNELEKYLKTANVTIDTNGKTLYQIYIKNINDKLFLFSAGRNEISLEKYME